jgi:mono/diheme cytochrome c family protein
LDPPPATASAEQVKAGSDRYSQYCAACHGDHGQTRGANFPDLTRTPLLHSQDGFDAVVLKGILSERGMASFASALQPDDTKAIRAYIINLANDAKRALAAVPPPGVTQPHQ